MQQYRLMHTPDGAILADHLTFPTSAEGGVLEGQTVYCTGVERDALLVSFNSPEPGSESAIAGTNGILKLTLHSNAYEWEFMTVNGESPDKGSQSCR